MLPIFVDRMDAVLPHEAAQREKIPLGNFCGSTFSEGGAGSSSRTRKRVNKSTKRLTLNQNPFFKTSACTIA